MIYDCKETLMDVEGRLYIEDDDEGVLKMYDLDPDGLEDGKRYLAVPEGIREISCTSFANYNNSDVALFIQNRLVDPARSREEWQKKLRGPKIIKITFPQEVSKTWFDRAEYMRRMELRVRFLRLYLPATVEKINPFDLPSLLEAIIVSENNNFFASEGGVLYTKDRKTLVRYPGFRDTQQDFTVPDEVEIIEAGAFKDACLGVLVIPDTVKEIRADAFHGVMMDELVLPENMEIIETGIFLNCDIRKIVLPKALKEIRDYAFRGTAGIAEVAAGRDLPKLGYGIFADGHFRGVGWWPWTRIPQGCFINSYIKKIEVPEGVKIIEDFAFAGCYKAKAITLPDSVQEVGSRSFDEGDSYSAEVTVPKHLLKYAYRFPALSRVNKMKKSDAWQKRTDTEFREDINILKRQRDAMQKYVDRITIMQVAQKIKYERQMQFILQLDRENI